MVVANGVISPQDVDGIVPYFVLGQELAATGNADVATAFGVVGTDIADDDM